MKPLKILIPVHVFFPEHFYGTETYTLELAKQLMDKGHEPVVLTATPFGEKGSGKEYDRYDYKDIPVYRIDLNLKPHHRFKQTYYRTDLHGLLKKIIGQINPDIAHVTHLINHTSAILEVLRDLNIPAVATLTDFFGICFNNKLERYDGVLCKGPNRWSTNCLACYFQAVNPQRLPGFVSAMIKNKKLCRPSATLFFLFSHMPGFRRSVLAGHVFDVVGRIYILRKLYGIYQKMIAPTDFLYEAYANNDFYPDRLKKINFGIDLKSVSQFSQVKKKRCKENIRFGYIGQIAYHKGVDLLVKAYCKVRGNNKSLIVYGPFDQEPTYMKKLRAISEGVDKVEFRGTFPRDELGCRLKELDFLVIPSRWYENSPLVLLYALATKTPVIVTDVKGLSEFVTNDLNGYTFKKNNIDQLRGIMQEIVDDPARLERLSENTAYKKDVSDHAREVLEIYKSVLE